MINKSMFLVFLVTTFSLQAEETWRFINLADWHWAEKYIAYDLKNQQSDAVEDDKQILRQIKKNYGGELLLLPGDSNGGHWTKPSFIKKNFPGATPQESVLRAGHLCYAGMIKVFKKEYPLMLMAVGDHELGDNPWPAGSAVARSQVQFREAFAKEFNRDPDGGRFRFDKAIGDAPSQPLGTKYEQTSYAYRHKNVLFITIDVFHQEDPEKNIGEEGSVIGTVVGKHLEWVEQVLSEARKDGSIKHIIVQAHLPVIHPVRKTNSSGMLMHGDTNNPLWQVMRKYKVDLYFAGEVHANTITKDPESDLIQVVTRGNFFDNFVTVDISDKRIELTLHDQVDKYQGDYKVAGRLMIDKSRVKTVIQDEGEFKLLDPKGRHLYFDFEEKVTLKDNPIVGLSGRDKKEKHKTLRGIKCTNVWANQGTFSSHYSALTANVEQVKGLHGKAGLFTKKSRMGIFTMGLLQGDRAVSYALWVKTVSSENQLLINSSSTWSNKLKGFFNLNLKNGIPEVMISVNQKIVADTNPINDGKWHHLAASLPKDGCKLSEVEIYVDGKLVNSTLSGSDTQLHFNNSVRMGFGGLNYSSRAFDKLNLTAFVGAMDELSVWTRPLTAREVSQMAQ